METAESARNIYVHSSRRAQSKTPNAKPDSHVALEVCEIVIESATTVAIL
jgi:hypothetical protein